MNNPNPLVPQGSMRAGSKSTFRNAVLMIVVIHVAFIGGFLLWGCSKDNTKDANAKTDASSKLPNEGDFGSNTAAAPGVASATNLTTTSNTTAGVIPGLGSNVPSAAAITGYPSSTSSVSVPSVSSPAPIVPSYPASSLPSDAAPVTEYTIVKNDNPDKIARNHHITVKALTEANPGLNAKNLQIGKKIHIPAAAAAPATAVGTSSNTATASAAGPLTGEAPAVASSETYTVKQGDNLTRIAGAHHTTIKAISSLNKLKTLNVTVGQKLKLPAPKAASSTTAAKPSAAKAPAAAALKAE